MTIEKSFVLMEDAMVWLAWSVDQYHKEKNFEIGFRTVGLRYQVWVRFDVEEQE